MAVRFHGTIQAHRAARLRAVCGRALACLLAAALAIQPAAAESLKQAMRAAYRSNPQLDAERARLRATDEEVPRASAGYRPTIRGSADYGTESTSTKPASSGAGVSSPWGYTISARQEVFSGFRTESAVNEAEATVRAGRQNLQLVEGRTLLDTVTAYMDVVRDTQVLRLREQNVAVLTRELEAAEARRAVREVTLTDVAQARARRARSVSAADLAKAKLRIARANYQKVVGHAVEAVAEPAPANGMLPRSLADALAVATEESPNVISALYREQAARHAVDKVRGELLPQVSVEASYDQRHDISQSYDEQGTASIVGRISVPFYEGGEVHARVRQAKHTHVSRLQEVEQARSETEANVSTAWSRLVAARAQIRADEVQVDSARIALDGVREEEKVGQRTLLDVLNAEQEYLDAQVALTQTRHDLVVAGYALLFTMGRLTAAALELDDEVYDPTAHYAEARSNWIGIDIADEAGRRASPAADAPSEPEPRPALPAPRRQPMRQTSPADGSTGSIAPERRVQPLTPPQQQAARGVSPADRRPPAGRQVAPAAAVPGLRGSLD
jgi:outer membrane protein